MICANPAYEGCAAKISDDYDFLFQIKETNGLAKVCGNLDEIPTKENIIKEVHLSIPAGSKLDIVELRRALENLIKQSRESLESLTFDDGNFTSNLIVYIISYFI